MHVLCQATRLNEFILDVDSSLQQILVDTGHDQALLTLVRNVVGSTRREVMMTGQAFSGQNVGEVFPVVSAITKLIDEDGKEDTAITHEAL